MNRLSSGSILWVRFSVETELKRLLSFRVVCFPCLVILTFCSGENAQTWSVLEQLLPRDTCMCAFSVCLVVNCDVIYWQVILTISDISRNVFLSIGEYSNHSRLHVHVWNAVSLRICTKCIVIFASVHSYVWITSIAVWPESWIVSYQKHDGCVALVVPKSLTIDFLSFVPVTIKIANIVLLEHT